jgi:peptidoglycan/xylan/chitin deacetylase (PgdA/CDA1 family)
MLISCSKETVYLVKEVVLTFDDAPNFPENTSRILDILKKHQTKATFFCIGESLRIYPDLASRISSEQYMANHTYTHPDLAKFDLNDIFEQEIKQTQDLIDSLQPNNLHFFRPPYGSLTSGQKEILVGKGFKVVMWDLSAEEWNDSVCTQQVLNYFHNNLFTAAENPVILFHLNKSTVEALDILLDEFEETGIDVIALDAL